MVGVPIAITTAPRFCRWVAVVTLALGLVAMHHRGGHLRPPRWLPRQLDRHDHAGHTG
jgi:hypothetical protein